MLAKHLEALLTGAGSPEELEALLVSNSNLPGPRGNLELAAAFGDCFDRIDPTGARWQMLLGWTGIPEEEAPTGDPHEFLPFCALQALGTLYPKAGAERRHQIVELLKRAAGDGRWRLREGVAMAFQRIGERDFGELRRILSHWLGEASPEGRRAIVAALAHPPVLRNPENARYCLEVSDRILKDMVGLDAKARKSEGFKVLRQGLEYAISVFVAALPEDGFAFLKRWGIVSDPDVKRIVKSNVGKARLAKKYPDQAAEIVGML